MLTVGSSAWRLCTQRNCGDKDRTPPPERAPLRMWLLSFITNASRVSEMRALVAKETSRDVSNMSSEAVIDATCDLVIAGAVHIHAEPLRFVGDKTRPKVAAPEPAPSFAPKPPPKAAGFKGPSIDPPPFGADVNLALQAAALVSAAAEGAPFCPI